MQPRTFRRGDSVLHEGASATSLYLIDDGHAAVRVVTRDGDTAMIRVLGPGQHFGELALLSPGARTASVDALDDLSLLALDRAAFDRLRQRRPKVEAVLTAIPGVASAHVLGIPDDERGTAVAAAVVPEPGVTLETEALRAKAAKELASYKQPRVIAIYAAAELPMLPSSKVDRRTLAAQLAARR